MSHFNEKTSFLSSLGAAAVAMVLAATATGTIALGFATGYASSPIPTGYVHAQIQAVVADTAARS